MDERELLRRIEQAAREGTTELNVSRSELTTLPPEIGQLRSLELADLRGNELTTLPPEIGQLSSLTVLDLRGNKLTALPPEIGQLSSLKWLYLSDNDLTSLPPQFGHLGSLQRLDLSYNRLTSFSPEIGHLVNLKWLNLSGNKLASVLPEIDRLINLTSLYFRNSGLTSLPLETTQLRELTELHLSGNELTFLPPEIIQLNNLSELYLRNNGLTSLPPQIGQLSSLQRLDLSGNELTFLPPEIGQLGSLQWLDLRDNPSLPLPPEIIAQREDARAIIAYCQENLWATARPLNEAKVILVGQGKVGKTSLVKRLIWDVFDPYETKTEGIDIQRWSVAVEGEDIRLNVWDFGGQEIMHATHQFFLTKRSLYLLVLDARLDEGENRVDYWLRIIRSFGGESPVIVVGNQVDQHPLDVNRSRLRTRHPNVKAIVETSCLTGKGIDDLKAAVAREVDVLPHIHDRLAISWFAIKGQLEGMETDYIPYEQYQKMCQAQGIDDETSQRTLVGFLHDLGVVLNYQEDPRLRWTHILNPEWVTRGVYRILNDHELFVECKGVLDHVLLARILDDHQYPEDRHDFILNMMRRFELCFDLEGYKGERVLIPDLLPRDEPYTGEWKAALAFEVHYDVLPGSVISRFIVRTNHLIYKNTYWRSGVVLARQDNKALVRGDEAENKVYIYVDGPASTRQTLLALIRDHLGYIHSTIAGIQAREMLPLPGHPEVAPVSLEHLLNLERADVPRYIPEGLVEMVDVQELLALVEPGRAGRAGQRPRSMFGATLSDPSRLRLTMTDRLSETELRNLCFDLGIDDETLPGVDKADKVRELVAFLLRRDRIGDLLDAGKRLYPDISWDEMFALE